MLRKAASKVVWVGRATVFLVGLAMILALLFGMASTAFGANGGNFILGSLNNTATAITKLTGTVGGGPTLRVSNPSTTIGSTALDLQVATGKAPMKVNSPTKVTNLNADKLDGKEESAFLGKTETAANADTLDGHDSTEFLQGNDGDAITGAQAIPSGTNDRLVLQHSDHSPEISIFYFCPSNLSNNGTLRIRNNGEEPINVFSDNGDTSPNAYKQLSHTQGFDQLAAASKAHLAAR